MQPSRCRARMMPDVRQLVEHQSKSDILDA
jgi:hypothetical protein